MHQISLTLFSIHNWRNIVIFIPHGKVRHACRIVRAINPVQKRPIYASGSDRPPTRHNNLRGCEFNKITVLRHNKNDILYHAYKKPRCQFQWFFTSNLLIQVQWWIIKDWVQISLKCATRILRLAHNIKIKYCSQW